MPDSTTSVWVQFRCGDTTGLVQGREILVRRGRGQGKVDGIICVVWKASHVLKGKRNVIWISGDVGVISKVVEVGGRDSEVRCVGPSLCVVTTSSEHVVLRPDIEEERGSEFQGWLVGHSLVRGGGGGERGREGEREGGRAHEECSIYIHIHVHVHVYSMCLSTYMYMYIYIIHVNVHAHVHAHVPVVGQI